MMQSLSFGDFDKQDFEKLLEYIIHIDKLHKVKALFVHPNYYAKIVFKYRDRLLSSSHNKGLDKVDLGTYAIDLQIVSSMNGDFCIVTEDMLKNIKGETNDKMVC